MNDANLEMLLHRILAGYLIFYYKQEKYELRKIFNLIRYQADILYDSIIHDEKYNDWIRQEYVDNILINLGLWTNDTQKTIVTLEKRIENLKVELFENFMNITLQKKIRTNLNSHKNQLDRIKSIRSEFLVNTLEGYASSIKYEFVICNSLYKNNKRIFILDNKDKNSSLLSYFNNIVSEINKYSISISDFKNLARSYIWRSYWNSNKNTNIFPGAISEWTDDQRSLVSFSQMYDSVYEHPECPSEKVIEDDDMLDGWMIVQKRKVDNIKKQISIDNANPNLKNAGEVFLFGKKQEEIEEILSLNSKESLNRLNEKIQAINNAKGFIEDSHLPDNRRQIISDAQNLIKNRK